MRRILIDECINPRLSPRLRADLPAYSVDSVRDLGWVGQRAHVLIAQIQGRVDVFLPIDKSFEFETLSFGVIVLETATSLMPSYQRVLDELVRLIPCVGPGEAIRIADRER